MTAGSTSLDEVLKLAGGDPDVAGWLARELLSGREVDELRLVITTARMTLEPLRESFEKGATVAALHAFRVCSGLYGFPLPKWAGDAISGAVVAWQAGDRDSLDHAFGVAPIKKPDQKGRQRANYWQGWIYLRVKELRADPDRLRGVTDESIFQDVAADIATRIETNPSFPRVGWKQVRDLYHDMARLLEK
jgi:hypothetical protein